MAKTKYPKLRKSRNRKSKGGYVSRLITINIKYIAGAVLSVASGYGGMKAYSYLTHLPYFDISNIKIKGTAMVEHSQIRKLVNTGYQQNIFELDTEIARRVLEEHPYIERAWVSRELPNTLDIKVKERTGFALVNVGGMYVVDEAGVVLEQLQGETFPNLPIISGVSEQLTPGEYCTEAPVTCGLQLLRELKEANLLQDVSEVNVQEPHDPVFYTLREGIEIRLGEGKIKQKLKYMKTVWQNLNARIKEVDSLDLRYKDMVVVKFKQIQNMV